MNCIAEPQARDWVSGPAVTLLAQMRRRGLSAGLVGAALGGGITQLRALLDGSQPVDATTAEVLASLLGAGRDFWLRRQSLYDEDLDRAVRRMTPREGDELLKRAPLPGVVNRRSEHDREEQLRQRLAFYGVSGTAEWERRYGGRRGAVVFRTSPTFASREGPTSLWLRRGEIGAGLVETSAWDRGTARVDPCYTPAEWLSPVRPLPTGSPYAACICWSRTCRRALTRWVSRERSGPLCRAKQSYAAP